MSLERNNEMRRRLVTAPPLDEAERRLKTVDSADAWYDYGMALSANGQPDAAVSAYSQGLSRYPFSPILYFGRGRRYIGPKKYNQALADFTMAIRLDPDIYSYWYYRAVTNNLSGRLQEAVYDFRRAMERTEPFERYGLIDWLFTCYVEMGDRESARRVLDEIGDDLPQPQIHYGYKRRVRLYKGLVSVEDLIDIPDIESHMLPQENRLQLEINTLLFGKYLYFKYHENEAAADQALLEVLSHRYEGSFATIKAEAAARKRGLIP